MKWLYHPITVFVLSQIVWLAVLVMWILWFVSELTSTNTLPSEYHYQSDNGPYTLTMLVIGIVLLTMLFLGFLFLFIRYLLQSRTMHQQRTFVSSVTHELRSPLASLKMLVETLESREVAKADQKKLLAIGHHDIDRLQRLISNILLASKLDRGISGFTDHTEKVNLNSTAYQVVSRSLWLDRNLETRVQIYCKQPEKMEINLPGLLVQLVFSNLIENAVKYSPANSKIEIYLERFGDTLHICVKDHGYGLSKDELKKIFRLFYRCKGSTEKAISGSGLGLFIVKSAMRIMGGKVWVESSGRNLGSAFKLIFTEQERKKNG